MDLSVITITWNSAGFIKQQLESVFQSQDVDFEVFCVDNNSSDQTVKIVEQNFPQVFLTKNSENLGFAKANNHAITRAQGRYILLLNPDMKVFPNTFAQMIKFMDEHQDVGVASCRLEKPDGKLVPHIRRFPKLFDQAMILLKIPHVFPKVLNKYLMKNFDYTKTQEVDSVRGSFFMIRKDVVEKLGGLDERFFIWFEEVDFCKQVKKLGLKVFYTPTAKAVDYVGKSFALVSGTKPQKYFTDSMLKYFKKWHPKSAWVIGILRPVGMFLARFK